jgi:hypothetical protein
MKKIYEKPEIEKIAFQTEERICGGLFSKLFNLDFASDDESMTQEAVFDWSELH